MWCNATVTTKTQRTIAGGQCGVMRPSQRRLSELHESHTFRNKLVNWQSSHLLLMRIIHHRCILPANILIISVSVCIPYSCVATSSLCDNVLWDTVCDNVLWDTMCENVCEIPCVTMYCEIPCVTMYVRYH